MKIGLASHTRHTFSLVANQTEVNICSAAHEWHIVRVPHVGCRSLKQLGPIYTPRWVLSGYKYTLRWLATGNGNTWLCCREIMMWWKTLSASTLHCIHFFCTTSMKRTRNVGITSQLSPATLLHEFEYIVFKLQFSVAARHQIYRQFDSNFLRQSLEKQGRQCTYNVTLGAFVELLLQWERNK